MHTLSDQLHATNMVSFVCACVWHVCGVCARCLCSGVLQVRCCSCAMARDGGCWNAVGLPVQ